MTSRAERFAARMAEQSSEATRLESGLPELETLYVELIQAFLPENSQFERDRIIRVLPRKREIVYICGLLNEGENEAALLLELIGETLARDPQAATDHLLDEMSYYLRTSIDSEWQLECAASAGAALTYIFAQLDQRLQQLRASPLHRPLDFERDRGLLATLMTQVPPENAQLLV